METRRIMQAIARVHTRDNLLLTQQNMEEFPCSDLIAIDSPWQKYSAGKFSFKSSRNK